MLHRIRGRISRVSSGVKSASVYTFANLFSKGLAIITVPIFTRIMTTSQIGTINLYNSWYTTLGSIVTLALASGGFSVAMKEYEDQRDEYISSILSLTSMIAIAMTLVFAAAPHFWSNVFDLPVSLIFLMTAGLLFTPARDFWLLRQRYEYKYKIPAILSMTSGVAASALAIAVVLFLKSRGSQYVVEGRLFSNGLIIYGIAAFFWVRTFLKGKTFYHKAYWKMGLSLSIPLLGHSIASQILTVSDRMMIGKMIGTREVGLYGTLYTVSSLSLMVWNSINSSYVPFLYQNIDQEEKRPKIVKLSTLLIGIYGIVACLFTFFAPEIVRILATKEYYESIYIMPPIAAGVFLTAISNMYSNVLLYNKKPKYIMLSTVIAAASNLILNLTFIPRFGYMAAAYTTLASYIVMAMMEAIFSNVVYRKITGKKRYIYENRILLGISFATISISLTGLLLYRFMLLRYLVIAVLACLLYLFVKKSDMIKG